MTYLVLARKWRPRSFDTLVGQDHVVRALSHALDTQRLHHAWLFTGTRGVGKTTLARILAKALNCEQGITATPCGTCMACTEIDAGRFVDYVELDAASNRGVDDMTQLLEQAVYAPSSGRFKVYMIDEVHMLSGHAFNAMLKTLEEPPAHVKFVLATTDPQKIPTTVLSRCLQFNLKQMPPDAIVGYLQTVLAKEDMAFEVPALHLLARAAAGSMRDALSLTDQAIAYCSGNLTAEAVQEMLGTVDQTHLFTLLQGLARSDATRIVETADALAMRGLSYSAALADLAQLLSRIAIEQRVPGATDPTDPDHEQISSLAATLDADQIQLFYAVAVHSRAELSLAPDAYAGFLMAGLRMLALQPPEAAAAPVAAPPTDASVRPQQSGTNGSSGQQPPAIASEAGSTSAAPAPVLPDSESARTAPRVAEPALAAPVSEPVPAPSGSGLAPESGPKSEAAVDTRPESRPHPEPEVEADVGPEFEPEPEPKIDADAESELEPGPEAEADVYAGPEFDPEPASWASESVPGPAFAHTFSGPDGEDAGIMAGAPNGAAGDGPRAAGDLAGMSTETWPTLVKALPLTGAAAELARQSEWLGADGTRIRLRMGVQTLGEISARTRLQTVLSEHFRKAVELDIVYGETGDSTAHAIDTAQRQAWQEQAEAAVNQDPLVNQLLAEFGGQIVSGSIQSLRR
ncbi:MAG TPA: DNA polymerase III subunit gamma/tau [Burkholderiaceae bacterium]|nr:DNA polymerase III subunit gamma/tau [Burkholderiaceae bacterium]